MTPRTLDDTFTQVPPGSADENVAPTHGPPQNAQRPSAGWLANPAWIDGGVNPPRYYYTHEEIEDTLRANGISPRARAEQHAAQMSRISPTPIPSIPAPLSFDLANLPQNNTATAAPATGYLVTVTLLYSEPPPAQGPRARVAAPKKGKITKLDNIVLEATTRVDFIKAFLRTHNIDDKYSPGVHSGPDFKLWWSASSGGKTGAPSIQNDAQFAIALQALFKRDKNKTHVFVEFDVDAMEGFRIKQVLPPSVVQDGAGAGEELAYGTRVPQTADFSDISQLNGRFILELKKKWPCQTHQGEHGEPGHCYVAPSGEHTRLNPLRLKAWAAAMSAGDATKHEPPSHPAFDGARNGLLPGPKSRGRSGPHPPIAPATSDSGRDAFVMLVSALVPLIGGLAQKRAYSDSTPPVTPKRAKTTSAVADSPIPEKGSELHHCLHDFARFEGVDLLSCETALSLEDYFPDIIPFVSDVEMRRILGSTHGIVIKFKKFCKEWQNRLEKKKGHA